MLWVFTSTIRCTLRSTHFWKSICKKQFFFPCVPPSLLSLWFTSEDVKFKPHIEGRNVFSLLPLFQWLEVETGPKRDSGDWIQPRHRTVLFAAASRTILLSLRGPLVTSKEHLCSLPAPQRFSSLPGSPVSVSARTTLLLHRISPCASPTIPHLGIWGTTITLIPALPLYRDHILALEPPC